MEDSIGRKEIQQNMKNASFWKGFGVGVIFTTIILGVSCLIRTSDAKIISQAKKLGMEFASEEKSVISTKIPMTASPEQSADVTPVATHKAKSAASENPKVVPTPDTTTTTKKSSSTKEPSEATDNKQTKTSKSSETPEEVMKNEKKKVQDEINSSKKSLEIKAGEWSDTVSRRLEQMGVIDNAKEFDAYLSKNGYGESISAGTYTVSPGDSYKELAEKITK